MASITASKPSAKMLAAYETLLASAQLCEPLGDETLIQLSLPALNSLFRSVGLPDIEVEGAAPADDVGQAKVQAPITAAGGEASPATQWAVGKIAEIADLDGAAVISCPAAEEQLGKQVFVKIEDLRAGFKGDLKKHVGTEVMFPLNADEEENLWAGPPVIAKTRSFTATIAVWKGQFGFMKCDELDLLFPEGVYLHGAAAWKGGVQTEVGEQVSFQLHVSDKGKPQASSPKPPGGAMSAENPAKRPRLMEKGLAKGGSPWDGGMDYGWGGKGKDGWGKDGWGKDGWGKDSWGKDNWGKGGWKDSGKAASGEKGDGGYAKGGKGAGGKAGKEGEEWLEGTIISYDPAKGYGFIQSPACEENVYAHTNVVEACGGYNGAYVQFKIHISKAGKPQASSPMFVVQ